MRPGYFTAAGTRHEIADPQFTVGGSRKQVLEGYIVVAGERKQWFRRGPAHIIIEQGGDMYAVEIGASALTATQLTVTGDTPRTNLQSGAADGSGGFYAFRPSGEPSRCTISGDTVAVENLDSSHGPSLAGYAAFRLNGSIYVANFNDGAIVRVTFADDGTYTSAALTEGAYDDNVANVNWNIGSGAIVGGAAYLTYDRRTAPGSSNRRWGIYRIDINGDVATPTLLTSPSPAPAFNSVEASISDGAHLYVSHGDESVTKVAIAGDAWTFETFGSLPTQSGAGYLTGVDL